MRRVAGELRGNDAAVALQVGEPHEPRFYVFSTQVLRGFVVSANLRHFLLVILCCGKMAVSANLRNSPQNMSGVDVSPAESHQNTHNSRVGPWKPSNSDEDLTRLGPTCDLRVFWWHSAGDTVYSSCFDGSLLETRL